MVAEMSEEKVYATFQQEKHHKFNYIANKSSDNSNSNMGCIHEANMKDSVVEANFGSNILIIYNPSNDIKSINSLIFNAATLIIPSC